MSIALALARTLDVSLDWLVGLPRQNPKELEPDEAELLRLYQSLAHEDKQVILGSVRLHARVIGKAE